MVVIRRDDFEGEMYIYIHASYPACRLSYAIARALKKQICDKLKLEHMLQHRPRDVLENLVIRPAGSFLSTSFLGRPQNQAWPPPPFRQHVLGEALDDGDTMLYNKEFIFICDYFC